jgi:CheY-like chemotaxis protein
VAKIKTILYCEDDPVVLTVYRKQLQQAGYHVIPAQDGLESMKNLSMFVPDLVVLDLLMPKFNGEEVLKYICNTPRLAKTPLIILSSNSVVDVGHEHLLERADKRLIKYHCTPAILLATIQEIFAGRLEENADCEAGSPDDGFPMAVRAATT